MKNRGFVRGLVSGVLVSALAIGLGVSALAASRTISVSDNVRVTINGARFTPKDEQGNEVALFNYNGTIYGPIRAVCEAAGLNVTYVADQNTAQLTTSEVALASDPAASTYITADKAKEIALADAGVTAAEAVFLKARLDFDDGRMVYEVEFYSGNTEYDYDIDATTGAILSVDHDLENYTIHDLWNSGTATQASITAAQAQEIALKHAGVSASSAVILKNQLDQDDGRLKYEVEFYVGNTEYDYDIDATSGTILSYDRDVEGYQVGQTGTATQASITAAQAQEIALKHAGVSASSAVVLKNQLERDDGYLKYEVEFYAGNTEYDYDIDATTGAILSYDRDIEDYVIGGQTGTVTSDDLITADEAKRLALAKVPSGTTVVKCELDRDDGRYVYELELRNGHTEYECDINAVTGVILDWETDYDD